MRHSRKPIHHGTRAAGNRHRRTVRWETSAGYLATGLGASPIPVFDMNHRRALLCCASIVATLLSLTASAQEWTRFRGPNGQGQSESAATIPITWTEADYNWKVDLRDVGHSSPVIWDDKVFVTSADPDTATRHVLCFDTKSGNQLWERDFPGKKYHVHNQNNFAVSTPALDDKRIYLAWASNDEFVLQALTHDGQDEWQINLGPFISQHGFGTSPIVVDDEVIITNDQEGEDRFLIAVDSATGKERWRIPRKYAENRQNASYATPCILETPAGRELIVCSWAYGITSHDLKTGAVNWEAPVFKLRPVGSPVLADGLILANCGEGQEGKGNNMVVAIKPGNKDGAAAQLMYSIPKSSAPYVTTICTAGDLAFLWGDGGIVSCIDIPTGKVLWRQRVGGVFYGSPVRVGDRIYCMSLDGDVVVLAAAPEYKLLARNSLGEGSQATPAIADGRMYLRTLSHLISIGGK
jgi:outer membrane protein assembly factor BamB